MKLVIEPKNFMGTTPVFNSTAEEIIYQLQKETEMDYEEASVIFEDLKKGEYVKYIPIFKNLTPDSSRSRYLFKSYFSVKELLTANYFVINWVGLDNKSSYEEGCFEHLCAALRKAHKEDSRFSQCQVTEYTPEDVLVKVYEPKELRKLWKSF